jgi:phage-related minor tail protein
MCYIKSVKIVKEKAKEAVKAYSLQLRPSVVAKVDAAAQSVGISRQKLIEAILEQVLADKSFVLEVKS